MTEFVGTFVLTLFVATSMSGELGSFAAGLLLFILVASGGYISGGHYNPAVSLAVGLSRGITLAQFKKYVAFQTLGALGASLVAVLLTGKTFHAGVDTIFFAPLFTEVIAVSLLCYTVLHTALSKQTEKNFSPALAIGGALTIAILFATPYSGAIINPAIAAGSFIASFLTKDISTFSSLVLGIVGPFTGAFLAAGLYGMQKK